MPEKVPEMLTAEGWVEYDEEGVECGEYGCACGGKECKAGCSPGVAEVIVKMGRRKPYFWAVSRTCACELEGNSYHAELEAFYS